MHPSIEHRFGSLDRVQPSLRLAAIRAFRSWLGTYLVETKDRLEVEQAQRFAIAIRAGRQREVTEEALARTNQSAEPFTFGFAAELEFRRVVDDQHVAVCARPPHRLSEVRGQDRVGRNLGVSEEPVRALELSLVERFRKALARAIGEDIDQQRQALGQADIAQVGFDDLR